MVKIFILSGFIVNTYLYIYCLVFVVFLRIYVLGLSLSWNQLFEAHKDKFCLWAMYMLPWRTVTVGWAPWCSTPTFIAAKWLQMVTNQSQDTPLAAWTSWPMRILPRQAGLQVVTNGYKWLQLVTSQSQYSTVQYSTVQYSTVQYSTVQYSTVQYSTVQYSTVQYSTVQYSTVQYSTVQYSTVQYSTVQYSTVQYSTVQYNHYGTSYLSALSKFWLQNLFGAGGVLVTKQVRNLSIIAAEASASLVIE